MGLQRPAGERCKHVVRQAIGERVEAGGHAASDIAEGLGLVDGVDEVDDEADDDNADSEDDGYDGDDNDNENDGIGDDADE